MTDETDSNRIPMFVHGGGPVLRADATSYARSLEAFREELAAGSTLFWTPEYKGHMNHDVSRPHHDALLTALPYNPNNVAAESSGVTTRYERELAETMCSEVFGYEPAKSWGYVCTGGTTGNIMGLWVAREKARATGRRDRTIVYASECCHYSVDKGCKLLDLELRRCPVDATNGRMILPAVLDQRTLAVIATVGTTEAGIIDDVADARRACSAVGAWLHADAAYGGYFVYTVPGGLTGTEVASLRALSGCDSGVVDMHKVGYAPYVASLFALRDGADRCHVDCASSVAYLDSRVSSAWTLEGSRAGALIAAAHFGHKMLAPSYPALMTAVIDGANRLRAVLNTAGFTVHRPTGLAMVLFSMAPAERMPYYAKCFAVPTNVQHGKITLVTTEIGGATLFRVVVMDPEFGAAAVERFVGRLTEEKASYDAEFGTSVHTRVEALRGIAEEVDTVDELRALVASGKRFVAYNGFEPSGRIHIAQAIVTVLNANAVFAAGGRMLIYIADWFAKLNHKMGGDLAKIKEVGRYFIEVFRAAGINPDTEFVWASDFIEGSRTYWPRVLDIAAHTTVNRVHK
ncbi:MAG: pyridoxal-dependent decarboxylase [Dehalococcoidia bacterium]|jgi:glutamate/tyrosine decarboxylase-like PLP-dependent enzyme|nr:pyridoxal-dependent decarboxylase [Dehalococcoidia bacterium]